ncbi:MAG TPA: DUF1287 domain-containing protein [Pyrinomonadaceae bacterium]|nr:DUF1287 domain-containing protein [Pyrinomonadaceae bacterium]HMP64612.1 DUF1287 domain-containing protein [Pyrinomonadaceae bacterium]
MFDQRSSFSVYAAAVTLAGFFLCSTGCTTYSKIVPFAEYSEAITVERPLLGEIQNTEIRKLLENAEEQLSLTTGYSQDYYAISYPNGDVPIETGACTDVVVRAFRNAGTDLQKEVHEDMRANFNAYPKKWGLKKPDTNIDHRRVPNLQTYFTRKGKSLAISSEGGNYMPGDVVSWELDDRGTTHIGLVSNRWNSAEGRYLIIHNIGRGVRLEDRLFEWKITGHFRYF